MRVRLAVLSALMILTACRDELPTSPNPQHSVADAPATFAWLPPIVKQSNATFANDATLLPHVRVRACAIATNSCVTLGGLVVDADKYQLDWKTSKTTPASRLYVDVAGTLVGQIDVTPKAGQTIPVKFRIARNALHVVGESGGVVSAANGAVTLTVPAGSLDQAIAITVAPLTEYPTQPGVVVIAGSVYDFNPDGASFDPPARLTIRYDENALPAGVRETDLRLGHLVNGVWTVIPGAVVNTVDNTVTAAASGFSAYGVIYSFTNGMLVQTVWGRGSATIDGVLSPGEWDNAAVDTFTVFLPDGTSTMGTYRIMNDDQRLYMSARFPQSSLPLETHMIVRSGSDQWEVVRNPLGTTFTDAFGSPGVPDVNQAGTNDGSGAVDNDGAFTTIEIEHALNSADDTHDMSVNVGDVMMYGITLLLGSPTAYAQSNAPHQWIAGRIIVAGTAPIMSGLGTATIDGVKAAGEWSLAACETFFVQMPSSPPVPATLCMMNDATDLYASLTFSANANEFISTFGLDLDRLNRTIDIGDDAIRSVARREFASGPPFGHTLTVSFTDNYVGPSGLQADVSTGGSINGTAGFTTWTFELSHPLNSGDVRDIDVSATSILNVRALFSFARGTGVVQDPLGNRITLFGAASNTSFPQNDLIQYLVW